VEISEKSVNRKVVVWHKHLQPTSGFARAGVYARPNFCSDFQACSPLKPLWAPALAKPPPR